MLLVVDANIVFSALIRRGKPLRVFELNKLLMKFEFIAPEFLFFEVGKRMDKILKLTDLSKEEFITVFSFIKKELELIPLETFEDKADEAKERSPHLKDMPYVALSLKFDCKILSGDKGIKECLPERVIIPSEAVRILFGRIAP
ncbi:MAG: PIN domain-containing protein [Methanosarcinales archaeon]